MDYGYREDAIKQDHYVYGDMRTERINPSGHWLAYVPRDKEVQRRNGLETMNCRNYGTLNALEILFKFQYGIKLDASERYSGVMTRTKKTGGSPHSAIEIIRKYSGIVPESTLPFDSTINTWEKYYSGVTSNMRIEGIKFIKQWDIRHEWVLDGTQGMNYHEVLKDALTYSPVGIAVDAWNKAGTTYYRNGGDTHWCTIVDYTPNTWIVYDSYDQNIKDLDWDFGFSRAKRYAIKKREFVDAEFVIRAVQGLTGMYL